MRSTSWLVKKYLAVRRFRLGSCSGFIFLQKAERINIKVTLFHAYFLLIIGRKLYFLIKYSPSTSLFKNQRTSSLPFAFELLDCMLVATLSFLAALSD